MNKNIINKNYFIESQSLHYYHSTVLYIKPNLSNEHNTGRKYNILVALMDAETHFLHSDVSSSRVSHRVDTLSTLWLS